MGAAVVIAAVIAAMVIAMAAVVAMATAKVWGPDQKMLFFQMVPKSFLSVLIHSTRCKYDSLDFFLKIFD
jgi:hypothetical protein